MTRQELRVGPLTATLELDGGTLRAVRLPKTIPEDLDAEIVSALIEQLQRFKLDLSAAPPFHGKVWARLRRIPRGTALTYSQVARELRNPRAVRAVGQACAKNRLLLVIPGHRVVAEDGLGGFGPGLAWKRKLLELEAND